jgi:excisionase family DNA binding protein
MVKSKDDLMSLSEAAAAYGYSGDYLRRLAEKGRLKAQKLGRNWLTTPDDMKSFIESREPRGVYKKHPRIPKK